MKEQDPSHDADMLTSSLESHLLFLVLICNRLGSAPVVSLWKMPTFPRICFVSGILGQGNQSEHLNN